MFKIIYSLLLSLIIGRLYFLIVMGGINLYWIGILIRRGGYILYLVGIFMVMGGILSVIIVLILYCLGIFYGNGWYFVNFNLFIF